MFIDVLNINVSHRSDDLDLEAEKSYENGDFENVNEGVSGESHGALKMFDWDMIMRLSLQMMVRMMGNDTMDEGKSW